MSTETYEMKIMNYENEKLLVLSEVPATFILHVIFHLQSAYSKLIMSLFKQLSSLLSISMSE